MSIVKRHCFILYLLKIKFQSFPSSFLFADMDKRHAHAYSRRLTSNPKIGLIQPEKEQDSQSPSTFNLFLK